MEYPMRHISIRVPWHDTGWDGRVCANPKGNSSCLRLQRIAENRDDDAEASIAGRSIEHLDRAQWPACIAERAAFMAPFEYVRTPNHPYNRGPDTQHGHFLATPLLHPPYSAPAIPSAWMLQKAMEDKGGEYGLDVQPDREPDLGFRTAWIQDRENQLALLNCFSDHLRPEKSLCFFYAKQVPFVEDTGGRRILIGVGRVLNVRPAVEYEYSTQDLSGKLRSVLWDRMIEHSIRPEFEDGFLLPYHAAIVEAEKNPEFDPATIAAFTPSDRSPEFSYVSELVSHDSAISSLLACAESLRKAKGVLDGPWDGCLQWIDARINELWTARGAYPGLGSVLNAFGLPLGNFIAHVLAEKAGDNGDPWPEVDAMFADPRGRLPEHLAQEIGETHRETWRQLSGERRTLLKLIGRFEITADQAKILWVQEERRRAEMEISDRAILENPYMLYELTRRRSEPVSVWTVDKGVYPSDMVRERHPLPSPTKMDSALDARRVRAFTVNILEDAADDGDSLLQQDRVVRRIRDLALQPPCQVTGDSMDAAKAHFSGAVCEVPMVDGEAALQLDRLSEAGTVIRRAVEKRRDGKRHVLKADWAAHLDSTLSGKSVGRPDRTDEHARKESIAALEELAAARISVLIGSAGTGKTTLVSALCSHPEIREGGILLLAPTGKARVRMEQAIGDPSLRGKTIAQFLTPHRFDWRTGYSLSDRAPERHGRTAIIDEASMLTEDMLAAVIQSLKGVERLILVGDPRQLPPIGPGRPFVDIVRRLEPDGIAGEFPRVAPCYAQLTVRHRQVGADRQDHRFAEWFGDSPMAASDDDVFDSVLGGEGSRHISFMQWNSVEDMRTRLMEVLVKELRLDNLEDIRGFEISLGGVELNDRRFFNAGYGGTKGSAAKSVEKWQILAPVRSAAHGVPDINRTIHKRFRRTMIEEARKEGWRRKIPKPMGAEEIVYGDKVINLVNGRREIFPDRDDAYVANGDIGVAVGYYHRKGRSDFRWKLEVEFSSQPGYKYAYTAGDFGEDRDAVLELAYALTVHKAQGSEFNTVILVLPNPCRLLSRELLYTALTRQRERVVILHQGAREDLLKYSSDSHSEIAQRLTNIFSTPSPVEIEERFFEEGLIHRTSRGEMVRSKSETIIADLLAQNGVNYSYEQKLSLGGSARYPDFTIEDAESGVNFYWEHCGMLHLPDYNARWERKLLWYREHGILPEEEGGGQNGSLIVTRDDERGGIDSAAIAEIIARLFD